MDTKNPKTQLKDLIDKTKKVTKPDKGQVYKPK